jgi:hypothetical protein
MYWGRFGRTSGWGSAVYMSLESFKDALVVTKAQWISSHTKPKLTEHPPVERGR